MFILFLFKMKFFNLVNLFFFFLGSKNVNFWELINRFKYFRIFVGIRIYFLRVKKYFNFINNWYII